MDKNSLAFLGLREGQMRSNDMVHNGGWYNEKGEKIGWGDLSPLDLKFIAGCLKEGEVFYVLSESDSFWNFVTHNPGIIGDLCETEPTEKNPGLEYVQDRAFWVVVPDQVYLVAEWLGDSDYEEERNLGGLRHRAVRKFSDIPGVDDGEEEEKEA